MTIFLSAILFLFIQFPVVNPTIDSLQQRSEQASDKEKVILLNELYKQYLNNDPAKALEYTRNALELAGEIGDQSGMASSYNNIGVLHKNKGDLDGALEHYFKALQIQEKNKFTDAIAYTYSNIGTVYSLKGEYSKALENFNKANDQFVSIGHTLRAIGTTNNIGNVYEAQGQYDEALKYYLRSLELYEELEDNSQAFVPFNNIGNIFFSKGKYDAAMAYYESALDLERINNDLNGQANALHNIGTIHKVRGSFQAALDRFNEAVSLVQETDNKRLLAIIYQSIAETYFSMGDTFMAYSFLRLNNLAKDSLYNQESSRRIAELENAYELEKKENEIRALKMEAQLQSLRIKNDNIIMLAGVIISLLGGGLTLVTLKRYKQIRRNKYLLERQNVALEQQKLIIQDKNQSITESIDYAKSVQRSLLQFQVTPEKLSRSFVYFKPKDIVSGDFFWYAEKDDFDIVAAVDCTGHGVAGAFMTVIGISSLEQIINREKIYEPAQILERLNTEVRNVLKLRANSGTDHGMDVALCKVDFKKEEVIFAGANRPLYYFRQGVFDEVKGTKRTIGEELFATGTAFEEHHIPFGAADTFYLTSDGFADQFGGEKGKKYMVARLKQLLKEIQSLSIQEQKQTLSQTIVKWQGNEEQTDDILVIGFKL
ncbi:serine/threonine kinase [Fulvivirga imtechensis AK7]|uniref:Serine/threonine kinase n=1 Tax=Fulvivirga imtechensis AK7 TaxID=1237149 RepID=L8JTT9_9BACT|nr:tetratricopeptide repeat protein [Fulvivirga imtechensis]ELR72411.1 serine/threonine kinase [Fulvivirga imtechensis AK7]